MSEQIIRYAIVSSFKIGFEGIIDTLCVKIKKDRTPSSINEYIWPNDIIEKT